MYEKRRKRMEEVGEGLQCEPPAEINKVKGQHERTPFHRVLADVRPSDGEASPAPTICAKSSLGSLKARKERNEGNVRETRQKRCVSITVASGPFARKGSGMEGRRGDACDVGETGFMRKKRGPQTGVAIRGLRGYAIQEIGCRRWDVAKRQNGEDR
ncbi:hypothetical protein C8J57DRAFT_1236772 [Mycena rebaudengoi]|nr:hypothetical protein C8J57DRAFT_1236772 [Mycena rebaudengoi]